DDAHLETGVEAAGTHWTRQPDGWHAADTDSSLLVRDADGNEVEVEVAPGSRALVDSSGELRVVVQPDGVSYDRDLSGQWSRPRVEPGEVSLHQLTEASE